MAAAGAATAGEAFDVVVVGLGPVGATTANMLGAMGFSVLVVEQTDGEESRPRAAAMDDENSRLMDNLGLAEAYTASTAQAPDIQMVSSYVSPGAPKPQLLSGSAAPGEGVGSPGAWPELRRKVPVGRNGWKKGARMFYQPKLESILREGISRFSNVEVRVRQSCVGVENVDGGADVQLQHDDGEWVPTQGGECRFSSKAQGPVHTVRCRFLLGCDGMTSTTRTQCIQSEMMSLDYDERWWAIDIMLRDDHAYFGTKLPHYSQFIVEPDRSYIIVPGAQVSDRPEQRRHVRIDIQVAPGDEESQLETETFVRKLISPWLADEDYDIVRWTLYRFWSAVAKSWRKQNVFLVGDSNHTTPPFLGQGLNQGIKDARNLCWKLALVMQGAADSSILDSYQAEREPIVRAAVKGAVNIGLILEEFKQAQQQGQDAVTQAVEAVKRERRGLEHGFPIAASQLVHGDQAQRSFTLLGDRLTGMTIPNVLVHSARAVPQSLDEVLGPMRCALLCISACGDAPRLDDAALRCLDSCGAAVVNLALKTPRVGCTHRVEVAETHELARFAPCAIFVRADRIVYGVAHLKDADALVLQFQKYLRPSMVPMFNESDVLRPSIVPMFTEPAVLTSRL